MGMRWLRLTRRNRHDRRFCDADRCGAGRGRHRTGGDVLHDEGLAGDLEQAAATVQVRCGACPSALSQAALRKVADINNVSEGGFGGAITAALYSRSSSAKRRPAHFDIMAWNTSHAPDDLSAAKHSLCGPCLRCTKTLPVVCDRHVQTVRRGRSFLSEFELNSSD